jgi:hypothetical protein
MTYIMLVKKHLGIELIVEELPVQYCHVQVLVYVFKSAK